MKSFIPAVILVLAAWVSALCLTLILSQAGVSLVPGLTERFSQPVWFFGLVGLPAALCCVLQIRQVQHATAQF